MNGKRNGTVKIYNNNELQHEGDYVNGMKQGKGIEYNRNYGMTYIYEFFKRNKFGIGKGYYYHYYDSNKKKFPFY